MPCEATDQCPYDPSPGDTALHADNVRAVWLWQRLDTLGPAVWALVDWHLTPAEAALLCEQVHTLITYSAALQRAQQEPTHG